MDNNELDKIIKEKLNNNIKPSKEFEQKIAKKIKEEKQKAETNKKFTKLQVVKKTRNYSKLAKMLSMAAVVILVFTLGINLRTAPIIGDEATANLISIKAIEPTKLEGGIVANNSDFTIYVEGDNVNTEAVQKSVYVEPALDYSIEKTLNKNEYKLRFKQNIPDNTIVKLQYVKNQITQDSWAYQTSNKFSITKTYPYNGATAVPKNTAIDIEFSYASVNNLEKYVKITPRINGTWKHLGKIWRFTPKGVFANAKKYTVIVSKQISAENQNLENDYKFSFNIDYDDAEYAYHKNISMDGIITAKSNELVKINYDAYSNTEIGKIEVAKFLSKEDFIEYIETTDYDKAIKHEEIKYNNIKNQILEFKQTLPKGYYVAIIKSKKGKELFNCPIQISDISAYAMETERDALVWVAQGNDLATNISVEYNGKTVKTHKHGIAKFENIADGSEKVKYATVAGELVIGLFNFKLENYPQAYIYTDRPLYKNTDTINIWGVVPRKLFYEKIEEDKFYIELNEEGKKRVSIDEDGNFTYKIDLKNHIDIDFASVSLYYKDTEIANRYIQIQNYELQNYTYEATTNKNYGFSGDKINFDVKVKHITGLLVPNKNVTAKYEGKIYRAKTGEDGIAHFTITLKEEDDTEYTEPRYQGVSIYNGDDIEYTDAEVYLPTYLLLRDVYAKDEFVGDNKFKATLYKLDTNKNANIEYDAKELYNGTYETDVEIDLVESVYTSVQTGEEYNEYTKQMEPTYEKVRSDNRTKLRTIKSKNGVIEFDKNEIKTKEDTELISYYYELEFKFKDSKGRNIKETESIYKNWYNESQYGYNTATENDTSGDRIWENTEKDFNEDYYTYRYLWDFDYSKFAVGEKVNFKLQEATTTGLKDIENNGKILNIFFKENIEDTSILTENNFSREYTDKDFPGFKMTSAYFKDGKFYRMPNKYFDFNEEENKVDIDITTDKEQYKPGDTVTVNIKTTKNGKGIKSFVNISVVNEAVFELQEDLTNILELIYSDKALAVYTFSSYLDDIKSIDGGKGGGDGEPRGEFADTAHFETIRTDRNGIAKIKFKLPDNVTTYRITAQSANEDLEIGVNTKQITSKLDFFVQSVEPRGIKTDDDLVLNATSIAETKYDVEYEFTIKELNKTLTAKGKTNSLVTVNFGKLPLGTYTAIIKGKHGDKQDAIEYKFNVVKSSQEVKTKTTMDINSDTKIKPSKNPIVLEIYNKKMEKYVEYMDFIERTYTERLDTQIAYNEIQSIKNKYYGTEFNSVNKLNMIIYQAEGGKLRNLRSGKGDLVLTALTTYYAREYTKDNALEELEKNDNIFEYYLYLAAKQEPVLQDLEYLKEENDISNYNKLLITLSYEFMGDYKNAKELYSTISLTDAEAKQYKSIVAIIETFINKDKVTEKIDDVIKNNPADEYIRFAILSFLKNNSNEIGKEETVKVKTPNGEQTEIINGVQIKTITLNNEDLSEISFETESNDMKVSYYYQTMLEEISGSNITKDIKISLTGNYKVGSTVKLKIEFNGNYEGDLRIALPNSLRLSKAQDEINENSRYYIQNNMINYLTIYKTKKCQSITLPLTVTNQGSYKFENIVCNEGGKYHISNSLKLNFK